MFQLKKSRILALFLVGAVSGCAAIDVPPPPEKPTQFAPIDAIPIQFFNVDKSSLPLATQWWGGFDDPILSQLIETALLHNRELEVAETNVRIVQAELARQRLETSYSTGSSVAVDIARSAAPNRDVTITASGGLSAGWEYDAFGRIAAAIDAVTLGVEAAKHAKQDVAVIVGSETALAYVDLRGAQRRLQVARDNAKLQAQSLDLLKVLFDNGRATALDVSRADAQYHTTLAQLPSFQAIIDGAMSRLAVLTGSSASQPPAIIVNLRNASAPIPKLGTVDSIGSPAEFIRRRPDIRAAETEIARRLALGDVDRARLFPTISLGADLSAIFGDGNRLDQLSSFGFGIGPAISWEGPDLRRVRADIDISDAETQRAYTLYEQTVLQALADVESALATLIHERKRQSALERAVASARKSVELAQLRFDEGVDDFLDVLDAQRTLLDTEDRLAQNALEITRLTILTYRELGGM